VTKDELFLNAGFVAVGYRCAAKVLLGCMCLPSDAKPRNGGHGTL